MKELSPGNENYHKVLQYLRCPVCNSSLVFADGSFSCSKCGANYKIVEGIVCFTEFDDAQYIKDVDFLRFEDLEQINLIISSERVESAKATIKEQYSFLYNYLFQQGRADWKFYIDLDEKSKILDLGCGWGNISYELALEYGNVTSVDISLSKLKFLDARASAERIDNIDLIKADWNTRLPFIDEYFDLVILNGALEWVGEYKNKKLPQEYQIELLKEIYRILKKDGTLYIGIENRYGYRYFLGNPDDHSRMRYTSLMPRKLANWYMKIKKGKEYRTYTYSYTGIKKFLSSIGFERVELFYSSLDYKYFSYLIPLGNSKALAYYLNYIYAQEKELAEILKGIVRSIYKRECGKTLQGIKDMLARVVLFQSLFEYFVPSFSIMAKR